MCMEELSTETNRIETVVVRLQLASILATVVFVATNDCLRSSCR